VAKRLIGCRLGVVNEVGRKMGVLDGWGSSKEKGNFGGKCGAPRCNQWDLVAYSYSLP